MPPAETPAFDLYREQVESMMEEQEPLGRIEQALERAELSPDERAALWLLAWSLSGRRRPGRDRAGRRSRRRGLVLAPVPGRA